jgi:hypothetical protein
VIWHCDNAFYSTECSSSQNILGCIGLKRKQYCILNKQYSEQEYYALIPKVIEHMRQTGEWGQVLDPSVCGFGYNESIAQEYYPMSGKQALAAGYNWTHSLDERNKKYLENLNKKNPSVEGLGDFDILKQTFYCRSSGAPFRLNSAELAFYKRNALPIPQYCFIERHRRRVNLTHRFKLYRSKSAKSGKDIWSVYPRDSGLRVYSEDEWLGENR